MQRRARQFIKTCRAEYYEFKFTICGHRRKLIPVQRPESEEATKVAAADEVINFTYIRPAAGFQMDSAHPARSLLLNYSRIIKGTRVRLIVLRGYHVYTSYNNNTVYIHVSGAAVWLCACCTGWRRVNWRRRAHAACILGDAAAENRRK